jgi:hypothetical protein
MSATKHDENHGLGDIAQGYGDSGKHRIWRRWLIICDCGWGSDDHLFEYAAKRAHRRHVVRKGIRK